MSQEVLEGNKLIAKFMGYKVHEWNYPDKSKGVLYKKGGDYESIDWLQSWDALMLVVEKIQSIDITPPPNYKGYRIEIVVQGYVKITGFPMDEVFTNVSREGSLIKAVWKAVIQFINFYNQTTKGKNG